MDVGRHGLRTGRPLSEPADDGGAELGRRILERLRATKRRRLALDHLIRSLGRDAADVERELARLEAAGEIVRDRKGRTALADRMGLVTGTVHVGRRGDAIVVPDVADAPLRLGRNHLRPAMDRDRVLVEPEAYTRGGLRRATLVRVLERGHRTVVGVVRADRPLIVEPSTTRLGPYYVHVDENGGAAPPPAADPSPPDDRVVEARIVAYPTASSDVRVVVERDFGRSGLLATELAAIRATHGLPGEFPSAVDREVERLEAPTATDLEGREDLRERPLVTIDPADAKDHDDAILVERRGDGFRATVCIADVSHYVRAGSALDDEAYERGTSVYLPGTVVPMLPERLSADLASLRQGQDRLVVAVHIDFSADGRRQSTDVRRAVMRSAAALSYEQAQRRLDAGGDGRAAGEEPRIDRALECARDCAEALFRRRIDRGAIDLDLAEAEIDVDEAGEPAAIRRRPRLAAHRLIEELMIAANEAVATLVYERRAPSLYRIHGGPDERAAARLGYGLGILGLRLAAGELTPATLQRVLDDVAGKPEARQVHLMVLRSMQQAAYAAEAGKHFGLASGCYTHFTSPIRRYPDLVVHRAVLSVVAGGAAAAPSSEVLAPVAKHCSKRERRAADAERDALAAAAAVFLTGRIGERFAAVVSSVERHGYAVELDEGAIEARVPLSRLSERLEYVADRMELQSRVSSTVVRIGDRVTVRLVDVDLADRSIVVEPVA